ncbi:MAG: amino acid adenylation domain-containing protein, partial [Candidatus Tectomicrobia bacterium]|nr:amino acid adenylation domain-containing protein [Candidatus Tectomicrobia bacterium]
TFRELLAQVRQVTQDAYEHQDIPFEQVIDELQPKRSLSYEPLVQMGFALQNAPMGAITLSGLHVNPVESEVQKVHRDMDWYLWEQGDTLAGECVYNRDLFNTVTIERMVEHFRTLLAGIATNPGQHIVTLPLLSEAERQQVLVGWNATETLYPLDLCMHQLLEAQVERTPEAVAVVYEEQQLTYAALNRRANYLAHRLRALGVGPEVPVGLYMEQSLEMVVGVLGILKAGGGYVPLAPDAPAERLTFMLNDAGIETVLTQEQLIAQLPATGAHVVCVDANSEGVNSALHELPTRDVRPDNLAYVLYTSGSTGQPKGVAVEHRHVVSYCQAIMDRCQLHNPMSYAMVQPLTVDSCVTMLFPSLLTGGVLHVIAREQSLDPEVLANYVCRYPIDCLKIAPSHLAAVLSPPILPNQRLIIGGEASRWEWVQELHTQTTCTIFNHYGPTETTVGVLTYQVGPSDQLHASTPSGRPLANTQAYILDRQLQPVPIGCPGELYIGGALVTRGYLKRPALTVEQFIPNPFGQGRLYKTGDVVRYLADGNIEFLGRMDNQVKIRGYRIELGEIEAVLGQHPAVEATVVVARDDGPGDNSYLVAYLVPHAGASTGVDELRAFLQAHLPAHMIPAAFVIIEALPLLPHGKVDRRALPAPDASSLSAATAYAAPRTVTEATLATIWAEVLG